MLDRLRIFVPFKPTVVAGGHVYASAHHAQESGFKGLVDLKKLNIPLQGSCDRADDGELTISELRHAWESLPSSFTPLAFKVHNNAAHYPGIELKASPAKLLQGHNVFGTLDMGLGASEMLTYVSIMYPDLYDLLEIESAECWEFDVTFSARMPSETVARQVVQALHNVSNGQTRARGDSFETTAYFGAKNSRLKKIKIYLKEFEFEKQYLDVTKLAFAGDKSSRRVYEVMSDFRLKEWVKNLLRLEVTVMKRALERRGIPTNLWQLIIHQKRQRGEGVCFLSEEWQHATRDIFKAWSGATMKVIDDEKVIASLRAVHVRYTRKGNPSYAYATQLYRTYKAIRDEGYQPARQVMPRTFDRHVKDIVAIGISKAQLQAMQSQVQNDNVIPLLRFVEVDFSAQRPDWYREPVSQFA